MGNPNPHHPHEADHLAKSMFAWFFFSSLAFAGLAFVYTQYF